MNIWTRYGIHSAEGTEKDPAGTHPVELQVPSTHAFRGSYSKWPECFGRRGCRLEIWHWRSPSVTVIVITGVPIQE